MEAVRKARHGDVTAIGNLVSKAVAELGPERGGAVWAAREARPHPPEPSLAAAMDDPDQLVLVALYEDVMFGYATAHIEHLRDGSSLCVIEEIYVEREARGVGLGEALIDQVIAWAWERGCSGIDAFVLPGNRAAKNFFESSGLVARAILVHRRLDAGVEP